MGQGVLLSESADIDFMVHGVFSYSYFWAYGLDYNNTCLCSYCHAGNYRLLLCGKQSCQTRV